MADFDYNTRREITRKRQAALDKRIEKLSGNDKELAKEVKGRERMGSVTLRVAKEFYSKPEKKPSQWFNQKGLLPGMRPHKALLDIFVPEHFQDSFLYIIDKLNQFPFSRGWNRRTVRTAGYGPQMVQAFSLLSVYEKLFYLGDRIEDYILRRMDPEMLDYVKNEWEINRGFSYIYAAEIDRGNQAVIGALKELILSENNTAYLDREMILGILRSDSGELHELICRLLLAARLQEGLRQAICETMDEGTPAAYRKLLKVIEDNDLIRFSSVKRAVSAWIGIFDENNVDRVNGKLLSLMGQALRDKEFCRKQLETNDAVAINTSLWALGFFEVQEAIQAMEVLIDKGTKAQKLAASYYNLNLYDESLKIRAAKKVVLEHSDDLELTAAFLPAYLAPLYRQIRDLLYGSGGRSVYPRESVTPRKPELTEYFRDREEAEKVYDIFMDIYKRLPKKGFTWSPCIFPWYSVGLAPSVVIEQLAFTAYVLQDEEKITYMAGRLGEITGSSYERSYLINLLLFSPANADQRKYLIEYMGSADSTSSEKAVQMVKKLTLTSEDYRIMEDMLRFKRSGLRAQLICFLMDQDGEDMKGCLSRLLADKKEEKRSAGLDMLLRLSKEKKREKCYESVRSLAETIENPTDKEKLLLKELLGGEEGTLPAASQKGFGIYDPDAPEAMLAAQKTSPGPDCLLPLSEEEAIEKIKKLDRLIAEYKDYEYDTAYGEKALLGNSYTCMTKENAGMRERYRLKNYPLPEVFAQFYEEEIGDYLTFVQWEARIFANAGDSYKNAGIFYKAVFGRMPFKPLPLNLVYWRQVQDIRLNFRFEYLDKKALLQAGLQAVRALTKVVTAENKNIKYQYKGWNGKMYDTSSLLNSLPVLNRYFEGLACWETDEEFAEAFETAWTFEKKCRENKKQRQFVASNTNSNSIIIGGGSGALTPINTYWFLKAYHLGLISRDILYKAVLEYFGRYDNLQIITKVEKGECIKPLNRRYMNVFFGQDVAKELYEKGESSLGPDTWLGSLIRELYQTIVPVMVDTELRRGEAETEFSGDIRGINYIRGTGYLTRILMALGKDTLGREAYYYWYYRSRLVTKRDVLSHLLKACYPAEGENGAALKEALKGTSIKAARLVEVAMYAPQWIDIIQEYLGWEGLKSGCYYFMAHMNERFDDQKAAIIARYTPLSPEELQDGAFDIDWFREAYGLLGEKNFSMLYNAAKYISDGQKHSRARKYADAATGKTKLSALGKEIKEKRNKDLIMSYGLVPFGEDKEKDMLERYQFIQQYLKESRQFGAQRRASEGKAAQIALVNLSTHAGFTDVTRLTLNMETRLAEQFKPYMEWTAVDDVEIMLTIDEDGKSSILCRKGGKTLKSLPSRLGKNPYVTEVKEANKKLKDQYLRTRKMMEESMETGAVFEAAEIGRLYENPVVQAILRPLVFGYGEKLGFLQVGGEGLCLLSWDGDVTLLSPDSRIRIAHPLDLYRLGSWHEYQKVLFDRQIRQPFKQVFRELYVKLPEELGQKASRMFAGNQIQPQKTVGCLKSRRWVADYEEGLQKIYYKENIVARIYALADWFSPSDVEAPTLEWVEFSDRKTYESLTIEKVPDLIYSEVMRDVDLAVSVAHAGGVDPETSHSTIEMRRAIVEFNLPLFGLKNVTLKDSHALIEGARASYTVHLGSGVIHQQGGAMLHILPVHSQKRGKLFLPFVDEDPKTAEIMSKIVLLAEDKKIKDPFILDQIRN